MVWVRVLTNTGVIIVLSVLLRYTVLLGLHECKLVAPIEAESAASHPERVTVFLASCYRKTKTNNGCRGHLSRVPFSYYNYTGSYNTNHFSIWPQFDCLIMHF